MLKSNKGVTLVALVITIIVLLILAGVSISLIVGDNGVLNQAVNSADATNQAAVQTELEMAVTAVVANWSEVKYTNSLTTAGHLATYITEENLKANMDSDKFEITYFKDLYDPVALSDQENKTVDSSNVEILYKGYYYNFTVSVTDSGNSAKVTYVGVTEKTLHNS